VGDLAYQAAKAAKPETAEEAIRRLRTEAEKLTNSLKAKTEDNAKLRDQNGLLERNKGHLSRELDKEVLETKRLRGIIESQEQRINSLKGEQERLKSDIEVVQAHNERLRTHIFRNESDLNPNRSEDFYIQNFEGLKGEVENWIAKHAKASLRLSPTLSAENETEVLNVLGILGIAGKESSKVLGETDALRKQYRDLRSRIILIRHIVAVFLFDQIFHPMMAGLVPCLDEALIWMEKDILSQGITMTFPRFLMSRDEV